MFGRPSNPKPIKVRVFAKTDLGKTRDHNEDSFLVADLTRGDASLQPTVREHELGPRGTLLVVADGMGVAAAGAGAGDGAPKTVYVRPRKDWGAGAAPLREALAGTAQRSRG